MKVIHGNLKPENIMLESNKEMTSIKVTGFGTCGTKVNEKNCYTAPENFEDN